MSKIQSNKQSPQIVWRLRECMKTAGVKTIVELHCRLSAVSPGALKYSHLARIVSVPPARLNLKTLAGLCVVLNCRPGDIIDVIAGQN